MRVLIKNSDDSVNKMIRDGVPLPVINDIAGTEVTLDPIDGFVHSHSFNDKTGRWNIAPECYEIVER